MCSCHGVHREFKQFGAVADNIFVLTLSRLREGVAVRMPNRPSVSEPMARRAPSLRANPDRKIS